ncbi:hypothetical protein CEXT_3081 [Caerostris extrusa]|uniref:Uncharacterized protein n=1 Tax=Caerostris extrusa TaxID=172846 RepID=A0AAV4WHF7_CAEEX|nr:hypothetical protein CEXT_3081 [Caerostris extrusa]
MKIVILKEGNDARAVKRPADDIIKPAKFINMSDDGFKTPGNYLKCLSKRNDDYSPTKPPPIMLASTVNCTHVLQEIHRKFHRTENKLTEGYIKIFPDTEDSY